MSNECDGKELADARDVMNLVEMARDGVVIIQEGKFRFVNQSFADILGYAAQELFDSPFVNHLLPEDVPSAVKRYERRMRGEQQPSVYEYTMKRQDGSGVPVEVNAAVITYQDRPGDLVLIRDITERKIGRQALEDSERRYRLLAENLSDVIWTVDMNLRFTYVSPSISKLRGYTAEEVMTQKALDIFTPKSLEVINSAVSEELAQEYSDDPYRSRTVELEVYHRDGHTIWTEVKASFLRDDQGLPVGILGVTRDISERKRVEDDLRQRAEKLEAQHRKLQATTEQKSTFFAGMSHELRTPMTSIIGFTELLLEDIEDPVSRGQRELLLKVSQNSHRLLGMINDLLDLSRMESGRMPISIDEVELARLISQIVANIGPLARDKNLEFLTPGKLSLPSVYTDEAKLSQILINLVSNAIKFTQFGKIEVSAEVADGKACISVSDTGIGIAKKDLRYIFDEFHRVSEIGQKKMPGTGLGLAITKRLCKLLGGKISVTSEVGVGSTFTVVLPNLQPK
jgi:PAS domain S-box-containing protein